MNVPASPFSTRPANNKENIVPFPCIDSTPPSPKVFSSPRTSTPSLSSSPLQLRVPKSRVAFAPHNRHHPYAHQPRQIPASRMIHKPAKSILRTPSTKFAAPPPGFDKLSPKEPTPEPEGDALQHPSYLASPIKTILASLRPEHDPAVLRITKKDLTEAYATLASRVRLQFRPTRPAIPIQPTCPALHLLRDSACDIATALARDLRRPLIEATSPGLTTPLDVSPFDVSSSDASGHDTDSSVASSSSPLSSSSSSPRSPKKKGVSAEEITHARDLFILTQSAIRVAAAILNTENLYSLFSHESLCLILEALIALPSAPRLFIPNVRKTTTLAMWGLQNIRVPAAVVSLSASAIVAAIERAITGKLGKEGKKGAGTEALNAVHLLSLQYPTVFVPLWGRLVRTILHSCASATTVVKSRAPHALGGIALALFKWEAENPTSPALIKTQKVISDTVLGYFAPSRGPDGSERDPPSVILTDALGVASSNFDTEAELTSSPQWAFSILAALVVLVGPAMFESSTLVTCVLENLNAVLSSKPNARSPAKSPQSSVRIAVKGISRLWWSSVVWAASKHGFGDGSVDSTLATIAQVKGSPVNACLVGQLLANGSEPEDIEDSTPSIKYVELAGNYLADVIQDSQNAGIYLLRRLVCGTAMEKEAENPFPTWDVSKMVSPALLDGSLLTADTKSLGAVVKEFMADAPSSDDVRALTPAELQNPSVWTALVSAWENLVSRIGFTFGPEGIEAPEVVFEIWKKLLESQAEALHATDNPPERRASVIHIIGENLAAFLEPAAKWGNIRTLQDKDDQIVSLTFVRKLWDITNEVLGPFVKADHAGSDVGKPLDASTLEFIPVTLVDGLLCPTDLTIDSQERPDLFDLWSELLSEVLLSAPTSSLTRICDDMVWEDDSSRELWRVLARRISRESSTEATQLDECLALMAVPFSESTEPISLQAAEWLLWEALLDIALAKADTSDDVRTRTLVLDKASELLLSCGAYEYRASLKGATLLVSKINFGSGPSQDEEMAEASPLALAAHLLSRNTPKSIRRPRDVELVLDLIGNLTNLVNESPPECVSRVLSVLQGGVSVWLMNERRDSMGISNEQYNEWVVPFYVGSLNAFKKMQSGPEILSTHCTLLTSVFPNPPPPEVGLVAFKKFWQECYMESNISRNKIPEDLLPVLRAYMVREGEAFAPCLSYGLDPSSSSSASIIEDSQPSSDVQDLEPCLGDVTEIVDETVSEICLPEESQVPAVIDVVQPTSQDVHHHVEDEEPEDMRVPSPDVLEQVAPVPIDAPIPYSPESPPPSDERASTPTELDSDVSHSPGEDWPRAADVYDEASQLMEGSGPDLYHPGDKAFLDDSNDSSQGSVDLGEGQVESIEIPNVELESVILTPEDQSTPPEVLDVTSSSQVELTVEVVVESPSQEINTTTGTEDSYPAADVVNGPEDSFMHDEEHDDDEIVESSLQVVRASVDPHSPSATPAFREPTLNDVPSTPCKSSQASQSSPEVLVTKPRTVSVPESSAPSALSRMSSFFMERLTHSMVSQKKATEASPATPLSSPHTSSQISTSKGRKRLFLDAVEVPLLSSLKRRSTFASPGVQVRDVFQETSVPRRTSFTGMLEAVSNASPLSSRPSKKRKQNSGLPQVVITSEENDCEPPETVLNTPVAGPSPVRESHQENLGSLVSAALVATVDAGEPEAFDDLIGSSALKRPRSTAESPNDDTETSSSPTREHLERRGPPLHRARSHPAPPPERSVSDKLSVRTQSLSSELVRHLRSAADASQGVHELDAERLVDLRKLLNNLHEEIDSALLGLATGKNKQ